MYRDQYTAHGIREHDLPRVALHDLPVVSRSEDFKEAMRAFAEKRPAVFKGR